MRYKYTPEFIQGTLLVPLSESPKSIGLSLTLKITDLPSHFVGPFLPGREEIRMMKLNGFLELLSASLFLGEKGPPSWGREVPKR